MGQLEDEEQELLYDDDNNDNNDDDDDDLQSLNPIKKELLNTKLRGSGGSKPCPICGMILSSTYNLTLHLRRHNNEKPFKCDKCPAAFTLRYELSSHAAVHSKVRPFICKFCGKGFKNVGSLRTHFRIHGFKDHKCKYCALRFKSKEERFEHESSAHNNDIVKYKCKYCYKSYADEDGLEYHEIHYHSKTKIKEPVARKERKYNGEDFKYYSCSKCPDRFKYKKDQIYHYQQYHEEEFSKLFEKCKICGKLLTQKYMSSHMEAHEGILPHKCQDCDYQTNRKNDLKNHQLTHTRNYRFKCSYCNKSYRTNSHVRQCERRHEGPKDIKCLKCEMMFYTYSELKTHINRKHKFHKCPLCTFETTLKSKYYHHQKKHKKEPLVGKKKFKCSKCDEEFPLYFNLRKHYRTHGDDYLLKRSKQNICSYCNYKGSSGSDILAHCISQHPDKVYHCTVCDYSTLNSNLFKNHGRIHSNICKEDFSLITDNDLSDIFDCNTNSLVLECFICGFLSYGQGTMKTHIQTHSSELQNFSWYCADFEEQLCFSFVKSSKKWNKPVKKSFVII